MKNYDEVYDYYEEVKNDVLEYIKNEINYLDFETLDDLGVYLNEATWNSDYVTGNPSGSYTCNTWQAEENLSHNFDLLCEALKEYGDSFSEINGAEEADVIIRCYVLNDAISKALLEIESDFDYAHEQEEEKDA